MTDEPKATPQPPAVADVLAQARGDGSDDPGGQADQIRAHIRDIPRPTPRQEKPTWRHSE